MKPAQTSPGGPSDSPDVSSLHAFGARFAARQIRYWKERRDAELADQYVELARLHLDRHVQQFRERLS